MTVGQTRPRVSVVYKRTTYQLWTKRGAVLFQQLEARDAEAAASIYAAHEEHMQSIAEARRVLKLAGAEARFRHHWEEGALENCDLVITLGGDGTLLWASHFVDAQTPMLAVNSAPSRSVGHFCAVGPGSLADAIQDALRGTLGGISLTRMQVQRDEDIITRRVLNDVLFCHEVPAEASRYALSFGHVEERHISSGVWVGPPAGSTAAMQSAGGKVLPMSSAQIQFVVREPYHTPGVTYRHLRGMLTKDDALTLRSEMASGRLYVDGSHRVHRIELGQMLRMSASADPLVLLGFDASGSRLLGHRAGRPVQRGA